MSVAALGGVASAAAAAACFDGGLAVQALDARQVPHEHGLRPALLMRLVRRPRWLAPVVLPRLRLRPPAGLLAFASGAAYAFTGITSKLLVDDLRNGALEGVLLWAALTGLFGLTGLLLEMSALQLRPATHVGPSIF